jgi:hypothetical protein
VTILKTVDDAHCSYDSITTLVLDTFTRTVRPRSIGDRKLNTPFTLRLRPMPFARSSAHRRYRTNPAGVSSALEPNLLQKDLNKCWIFGLPRGRNRRQGKPKTIGLARRSRCYNLLCFSHELYLQNTTPSDDFS